MTDVFGDTTTTLTKMVPVAATIGILHGATRKRATPKRRLTTRRRPTKAVSKVRPRRLKRRKQR